MLIHINDLDLGGAEKSLLNFIEYYKNDFDITLLLVNFQGGFKEQLPEEVAVIQLYATKLGVLVHKLCTLFFPYIIKKYVQSKLPGEYDYVVAYLELFPTITLKNISARHKKIAFLHNNILALQKSTKIPLHSAWDAYKHYDHIACVSQDAKIALLSLKPELTSKVMVINNLQDQIKILKKSEENFSEFNSDVLNLVTVARFEPQKRLDRIIELARKLRNQEVVFHIVGQGTEFNNIEKLIVRNDLSDKIKLYGPQQNPYKFIKNADALLMVSQFEGFPMVFQEAKILKTPILTTDVSDARDSIDKKYGYVCANSTDAMYKLLSEIIDKNLSLDIIRNNYEKSHFDINKDTKEQLEKIITK